MIPWVQTWAARNARKLPLLAIALVVVVQFVIYRSLVATPCTILSMTPQRTLNRDAIWDHYTHRSGDFPDAQPQLRDAKQALFAQLDDDSPLQLRLACSRWPELELLRSALSDVFGLLRVCLGLVADAFRPGAVVHPLGTAVRYASWGAFPFVAAGLGRPMLAAMLLLLFRFLHGVYIRLQHLVSYGTPFLPADYEYPPLPFEFLVTHLQPLEHDELTPIYTRQQMLETARDLAHTPQQRTQFYEEAFHRHRSTAASRALTHLVLLWLLYSLRLALGAGWTCALFVPLFVLEPQLRNLLARDVRFETVHLLVLAAALLFENACPPAVLLLMGLQYAQQSQEPLDPLFSVSAMAACLLRVPLVPLLAPYVSAALDATGPLGAALRALPRDLPPHSLGAMDAAAPWTVFLWLAWLLPGAAAVAFAVRVFKAERLPRLGRSFVLSASLAALSAGALAVRYFLFAAPAELPTLDSSLGLHHASEPSTAELARLAALGFAAVVELLCRAAHVRAAPADAALPLLLFAALGPDMAAVPVIGSAVVAELARLLVAARSL